MQNNRNTLVIFLTLALMALGCKKENDDDGTVTPTATAPPNNGINEYEGLPNEGQSKVLFWSRLSAFSFYLDFDGQSIPFDNVYTSSGNGPQSCSSPNGLSFNLDPGTYNYRLHNDNLGISATGSVTLEMGQCRIIEFAEPPSMWGKGKLLIYAGSIAGDQICFTYEDDPWFYPYLTEEFSTAPEAFSHGAYSEYMEPGTYQLRVFDSEGVPGALIDTFPFEVVAGQQTTLRLEEI